MTRTFVKAACLAMAVSAAACGGVSNGSTGGGTCGQIEPCGGNPEGTWKVTSSCANSAALMSAFTEGLGGSCTGATISNVSVTSSGTLSVNSDMSYVITGTQNVKFTMTLPASCLNGETCADLTTELQNDFPNASCTGTGSCACALTENNSQDDSGTYTISGTQILISSAAQGPSTQSFCVQGNTLHLIEVDTTMNMGPMGMATIDDDTLFTKQ
jgi:hypothetical protein